MSCYTYFSFLLRLCHPVSPFVFFSYVAVHPQLLSSVLQTLSFSSFFCHLLSLNVLSEMISSSLKCCSPEASCIQSFDWGKKNKQTQKHFVLLFLEISEKKKIKHKINFPPWVINFIMLNGIIQADMLLIVFMPVSWDASF